MKLHMKLSDHFPLAEALFSAKAAKKRVPNIPTDEQIDVMKKAAVGMERVRALLGNNPVSVSSWFRSPVVNKLVGGGTKSQHLKGEAIDFNCFGFGSPREICELLVAHMDLIRFDQLILENGWVHISFAVVSRKVPRKQVLTITPDGDTHVGLVHYK